MTKYYRVLIKQKEYRNCYVLADSEEQARKKFEDGDEYDSEFLSAEDTEIVSVEEWG
jgi:DNA-dependent RNA polymerase auxiliary subunit epsilon